MKTIFEILGFIVLIGILPFGLGFFAQLVFRKRKFHFLSGWIASFISVLSQWFLMHTTALTLGESNAPSIIGSFLILGIFLSLGIKLGFPSKQSNS